MLDSKFLKLNWEKIFRFEILILGIGMLFISVFPFPSYDDWVYAIKGIKNSENFLSPILYEYNHWNGRYTSAAFMTHSPLTWSTNSYLRFFPLLSFFCFYLSSLLLFREVTIKKTIDFKIASITLILCLLMTFSSRDASTFFYWFAGNVNYYLPWIFHSLQIVVLLRWRNGSFSSSLSLFLLVPICVMSVGFNEVAMLTCFWIHVAFFLNYPIDSFLPRLQKLNRHELLVFLVLLALIIFCIFVVVAAPGNSLRGSHFDDSGSILRTLFGPIIFFPYHLIRIIAAGIPLFLFSLFLFKSPRINTIRKVPVSLMILIFLAYLTLFMPKFYGTGGGPNNRILSYLNFPFLILFFAFSRFYLDRFNHFYKKYRSMAFLLVAIYFVFSTNASKFLFRFPANLVAVENSSQAWSSHLKGKELPTLSWPKRFFPEREIRKWDKDRKHHKEYLKALEGAASR